MGILSPETANQHLNQRGDCSETNNLADDRHEWLALSTYRTIMRDIVAYAVGADSGANAFKITVRE